MRGTALTFLFTVAAFAQAGKYGAFTNADDVGAPKLKGSTEYSAATGEYKVSGSGADIWGRSDQFHYLWREMTGNFTVTTTAKFLTEGIGHRKAVIMLRKSLDADSPFVQLALHGDGMPSIQFRNAKADTTNTIDFPVEGPGVWRLKLVRQGTTIGVWAAKDGAPLRELGHTMSQIGNPVLLGLGVSSHTVDAVNTVLFSDVAVEELTPSKLGVFTKTADVGGPAIAGATEFTASNGQYKMTGAGANIWAKQDQFQFAWKEMTGNFAASATLRFLGEGNEHRKAGIMVRQSLDTDATYADIAMHGNGMPGLQWRSRKGEDTNTFDLPFDGPGTFDIRLVRNGVRIFMYLAKDGGMLREIAHTEVTFQGPVLLGLFVCSHDAAKQETAVFTNVSLEPRK